MPKPSKPMGLCFGGQTVCSNVRLEGSCHVTSMKTMFETRKALCLLPWLALVFAPV